MKSAIAGSILTSLSFVLLWAAMTTAAQAQANATSCSLSTLKGTYSVQGQGTVIAQLPGFPVPPFPFAEVAVDLFDGAGNVSGKATVNIDGVVMQATVAGTYVLNSDCTGTLSLQTSVGLPVNESFVVLRNGGLRLVDTDSYVVVSRNMEKMRD
jgi:hypothetical protein